VSVKLGCVGSAGTTCTGQVAATTRVRHKRKPVVVGLARYTITAGHVKVVRVKLNKRGRRLLKAQLRLKVTVVVKVLTTNGLTQAVTKRVTLKARTRRR
jgi:hypothetical protein